mgnify:CR=1 FL=1
MSRKYFGTDGIRGKANSKPMTAETALRVGMAAGRYFTRGDHRHRVVIGNDAEVRYSLALPPDQIRIEHVLQVAESIRLGSDEARNHPGWVVLRELSAAQRAAAGDMTLAKLLAQSSGDAISESKRAEPTP